MIKLVFGNTKINETFLAELFCSAHFRVEMVLPGNPRKDFPRARDLEALSK